MDYEFWSCGLYSTSNCSGLAEMVLIGFSSSEKVFWSCFLLGQK